MENGENIGIQLEVMRHELKTTWGQFGAHVTNRHRGRPPSSCHECINFKQVIVLQEYQIGKLVGALNAQAQRPLSE